jgi:hypothetical protein
MALAAALGGSVGHRLILPALILHDGVVRIVPLAGPCYGKPPSGGSFSRRCDWTLALLHDSRPFADWNDRYNKDAARDWFLATSFSASREDYWKTRIAR